MNPRAGERLASNAMLALRAVISAVGEGRPADRTLTQMLRANPKWGSRDRRFISQTVFAFFRWRGWLRDIELEHAAALAHSLETGSPHVSQTVLAGRELPAWGALDIPAKMSALAAETGRELGIEMLVPGWLKESLDDGATVDFASLISSFQQRPPTWLRALAGHEAAVISALEKYEAAPRPHAFLRSAIACESGVNFPEMRQTTGPVFEVQDIASQAVGFVCAPAPGARWWDACAASGGKALHLAALMNNSGEIIATDVRESALAQLAKRTVESGAKIIRPLPARAIPSGQFDGVLVDAPCSGIGTWSRNPDMRWRTSPGQIEHCANTQRELLALAADRVKPGGTLVYSVCTITLAETTAMRDHFLASRPDFVPADFPHPLLPAPLPASAVSILPADGPGDGMYIAKFRKRA